MEGEGAGRGSVMCKRKAWRTEGGLRGAHGSYQPRQGWSWSWCRGRADEAGTSRVREVQAGRRPGQCWVAGDMQWGRLQAPRSQPRQARVRGRSAGPLLTCGRRVLEPGTSTDLQGKLQSLPSARPDTEPGRLPPLPTAQGSLQDPQRAARPDQFQEPGHQRELSGSASGHSSEEGHRLPQGPVEVPDLTP